MNPSPDNNSVAWQCHDVQIIATSSENRMTSTIFCFVFQSEKKKYILAVTFKTRDIWRFTSEKKHLLVLYNSFQTVDITAFLIFQ